ncbi:uncharacterized protein SPAPADRAFT_69796 [Spathaspora passalidarum NRRL Y-27907]|uniref:CAP-Gly domain-containing protein n=1 Tax=Spathaspora passalidarum (strain NRRL Y-27907 / 11-Y1) TaxID=619300 RepID=G3AE75_SPAPN|nr:uncharacterized protein SPAPADRAFT_69796 [Spathaspora passalidarum NRRL Y-27907]EGW35609.1 hypothetical protein SPAPADRAFT_69796 [Spathaspora passalidarum NRRL Y-27907]
MNYSEYDRISTIDNKLATVRYIGTIPQWGDTLALGLEWDEATRGKNNGEVNGITYFTPTVPNSVTFIKSTNKKLVHKCKSFVQIIKEKYLDAEYIEADIQFGSKTVEEFGWEKLNKFQSNLSNLTSLTLDFHLINRADYDKSIFTNLGNLTHLELSFNLFNDITEVWKIVDLLPGLRELNLNGNRFYKFSPTNTHNLKVLKLSSTLVTVANLNEHILPKFPKLTELYISGNNYTNEDINNLNLPAQLEVLDVSYNQLTIFPKVNISSLNLSHNNISDYSNVSQLNITSLDLRNNQIMSYSFIDWLSEAAPNLQILRINHNPLFQDIDIMTTQLIARFYCQDYHAIPHTKLYKLNGSLLTNDEIENSELYFISKVQMGEYQIDKRAKKWLYLLDKYKPKPTTINIQPDWISLTINIPNKDPVQRLFLLNNSILRIKGIISKLYLDNMSILQFKLYYYIDTSIKQELKDYLSILDTYSLSPSQNIYIDYS